VVRAQGREPAGRRHADGGSSAVPDTPCALMPPDTASGAWPMTLALEPASIVRPCACCVHAPTATQPIAGARLPCLNPPCRHPKPPGGGPGGGPPEEPLTQRAGGRGGGGGGGGIQTYHGVRPWLRLQPSQVPPGAVAAAGRRAGEKQRGLWGGTQLLVRTRHNSVQNDRCGRVFANLHVATSTCLYIIIPPSCQVRRTMHPTYEACAAERCVSGDGRP
jgi:hypothetical protein